MRGKKRKSLPASVNIDPISGGGRYRDVLDACEAVRHRFGSKVNALANMVRESRTYQTWAKAEEQ